jgi:hypothetical protein
MNYDKIFDELVEKGVSSEYEGLTDVALCSDFLAFNMHNEDFLSDLLGALLGDEEALLMIQSDIRESVNRFLEKD